MTGMTSGTPSTRMHALVVMPHSWGRGETIAEAERLARQHGGHGRRKVSRIVYEFNPDKTRDVGVDDLGRVHWTGEAPTEIARTIVSAGGGSKR